MTTIHAGCFWGGEETRGNGLLLQQMAGQQQGGMRS